MALAAGYSILERHLLILEETAVLFQQIRGVEAVLLVLTAMVIPVSLEVRVQEGRVVLVTRVLVVLGGRERLSELAAPAVAELNLR